jgi:hypothetical protein
VVNVKTSENEPALPDHVLATAVTSGRELAWGPGEAATAVEACAEAGLGCLGGEVQFALPGATCELFWRGLDNGGASAEEPWEQYVARSAASAVAWLTRLLASPDLLQDAKASFADVRLIEEQGANPLAYLRFVLYFVAQNSGRPEDTK